MHTSKYYVKDVIIRMYKKPWQPVICVISGKQEAEFAINDNQIELISGEIEEELLPGVRSLIKQYFLPMKEIKRKRPE
ncbi:hypothetical protein SAMN05428988_0176 [Chitinophaga sp. YR573]|uniref:hypothetical protein n=1 Tax=Chitinophaga sp. YR573 TaxID=1881040 RepID=UPI0008B95DDF|nr:hypothetical protein [Chitinophaga sp. YR573]SEV89105.1 hypothetical protein SAMN05428988_0176 [Chitinophaga sp. YR573]